MRPVLASHAPVLVIDAGSPTVTVALGRRDGVFAAATLSQRHASHRLLTAVDTLLRVHDLEPAAIAALVVLRGPGSFTGLRIGLATALGWRDALGVPVASPSTSAALAASHAHTAAPGTVIGAAVDALRETWHVRRFRVGADGGGVRALDGGRLLAGADLAAVDADALVGFGLPVADPPGAGPRRWAPVGVVGAALRLALDGEARLWDPDRLVEPVYFRPPAVTLPARP